MLEIRKIKKAKYQNGEQKAAILVFRD